MCSRFQAVKMILRSIFREDSSIWELGFWDFGIIISNPKILIPKS